VKRKTDWAGGTEGAHPGVDTPAGQCPRTPRLPTELLLQCSAVQPECLHVARNHNYPLVYHIDELTPEKDINKSVGYYYRQEDRGEEEISEEAHHHHGTTH